jgi:anti-sigma factor RsiW
LLTSLGKQSACLSDLTIDQSLAGELDGEQKRQLEEHAAACEPCRARLELLRQTSANLLSAIDPPRATADLLQRWARQSRSSVRSSAPINGWRVGLRSGQRGLAPSR